MTNIFDITRIEESVKAAIAPLDISKNIYFNRPKASMSVNDFVVIRVGGNISDKHTYGECVVYIDLFAKDANSLKNGKKLSAMYQKFAKGFPASIENLLFDTEPTIMGDTPDDYGYHARIIRIKTTIKAI